MPGWTYYDTIEGFALYENDNYLPMGFTYDYYVDEEQLDSLPTQDACALLVRALALTDEDIAAYGSSATSATSRTSLTAGRRPAAALS